MGFSDAFLHRLTQARVEGEFPPFLAGTIDQTNNYIRKLLAELATISTLVVEADFDSYGSGFASYVEVRVSKRDKSDTQVVSNGSHVTHTTDGLLLYISRLTPYWFYGGSNWSKTYEQGRLTGGTSDFLTPQSPSNINQSAWAADRRRVEAVLQHFRYGLLTPEELTQPAPAGISIPTILADAPYHVFDCFFYWED